MILLVSIDYVTFVTQQGFFNFKEEICNK